MCTVVWGTAATLYGGYAVLFKKQYGMGSYEWFLVLSCMAIYFIVSLLTAPPEKAHLDRLFSKA